MVATMTVAGSLQGAQLLRRGRAMFRVTEYFAVTQDHLRSFEMTPLSSLYYYSIVSCN